MTARIPPTETVWRLEAPDSRSLTSTCRVDHGTAVPSTNRPCPCSVCFAFIEMNASCLRRHSLFVVFLFLFDIGMAIFFIESFRRVSLIDLWPLQNLCSANISFFLSSGRPRRVRSSIECGIIVFATLVPLGFIQLQALRQDRASAACSCFCYPSSHVPRAPLAAVGPGTCYQTLASYNQQEFVREIGIGYPVRTNA
jgi:hypothetical protein